MVQKDFHNMKTLINIKDWQTLKMVSKKMRITPSAFTRLAIFKVIDEMGLDTKKDILTTKLEENKS